MLYVLLCHLVSMIMIHHHYTTFIYYAFEIILKLFCDATELLVIYQLLTAIFQTFLNLILHC